jgi:hypothetical protein
MSETNFGFAPNSLQDIGDAIMEPDSDSDPFSASLTEEGEEEKAEVRCRLITGEGGSGKTYKIKKEIEEDSTAGLLCATTGIASVNLNAITLNSVLRFFDTDSLQQAYINGRLVRTIGDLAKSYKQLIIDEFSMLDAAQLDTLYKAVGDANRQQKVKKSKNPDGIGLTLVGDLFQLPAIKCKQPYEAECFPKFEEKMEKLTYNWRQGSGEFLTGINKLRAGNGEEGAELLRTAGVEFTNANSLDFSGTTILAKNVDVDRFNWVALSKVEGEIIKVRSERWLDGSARPPGEWKIIPEELQVKKNSYVMILSNDSPSFTYANGDCGWIQDYDEIAKVFTIKLVRGDRIVRVPLIERRVLSKDGEATLTFSKREERNGDPRPWQQVYFDIDADRYVVGAVRFSPLRLAYASTVHKTQSLTIDRVQMDIRQAFFGMPAMIYTAVSRCRTPEGLRIVGDKSLLAKRTKVNPAILRFL